MEVEDGVGFAQQQLFEKEKFDVSSPLRGVVLCCTSIPADKRVRSADFDMKGTILLHLVQMLTDNSMSCRPKWRCRQNKWVLSTNMT